MNLLRMFLMGLFLLFGNTVMAVACAGSYVVKAGDTLSGIAISQLGSFFAYESIYVGNRDVIGPDPNRIDIGMALSLPCPGDADNPVNWAVMPSAATVANLQKITQLQILDIRPRSAVNKGVIPGALSVPYTVWRGPAENPSTNLTAQTMSQIVSDAGLRTDIPVVIVHSRPNVMDKGRAALVYWMLKSTGFETIAILQDGFQGWTNADLPVADAPETPDPYLVALTFSDKWRADEVDVYGIATNQIAGFLMDARPQSIFAKQDDAGQPLGTTLPGARNAPVRPLMSNFSEDVSVEEGVKAVVDHLQRYNADWRTGEVVTFCQTGELGALSWFYASELAGLDNMVLYPESVSGWADKGGKLFAGEN